MAEDRQIEREDRDLIGRMASKDAAALDAFYSRYNRLAFSLIFRIVGSREDAEDVLVDVFWQIWQQAARYDPSRGKPVAWLRTITRTRAIDAVRGGRKMSAAIRVTRDPRILNLCPMRSFLPALSTVPVPDRTNAEYRSSEILRLITRNYGDERGIG